MLAFLRKFRRRRVEVEMLAPTPTALELHMSDGSTQDVPWQSIDRVEVWKRDLFTVDHLCMGFHTDAGWWTVHEGMPGWDVLMKGLHHWLPGAVAWEEWFSAVAFPAFATNRSVIYGRETNVS